MEAWQARWPQVGDVRGLGSMLAIELVESDGEGRRPPSSPRGSSTAPSSVGSCCSRRASHGNCIRVLVPLVISDGELDEALDVWEDALVAALLRAARPG